MGNIFYIALSQLFYMPNYSITNEGILLDCCKHPNNDLIAHLQAENIQSEIQKLRELIDQSESIILINLDSQRNIMLRLSLQLEMGMFSAAIAGLIGMAFGMNLDSSLEEVKREVEGSVTIFTICPVNLEFLLLLVSVCKQTLSSDLVG